MAAVPRTVAAGAAGAAGTAGTAREPPPPWLRTAVRDVLSRSSAYAAMPPDGRRALAQAMVQVSALAAQCVQEENDAQQQINRQAARRGEPLAQGLEAQPDFGAATRMISQTTRDTLNAISFPRFVTDLINGVFRAMNDSNQVQMNQYLQLLNAVSGSAQGFEATQTSELQARQWVVDQFPEQIEVEPVERDDEPPQPGDEPPDPEDVEVPRLRLRANARMPSEDALRSALGIPPGEPVEAGNPEALVPFARRQIARQRQQMLSTMVLMGMNRIVIDAGKINAAMRFHIDTRSAAAQDRASQFGMQNRVRAGASASFGPWGASAEVENTISYVNTERNQRTEEINTQAELNSSVELHFHTDAVPLNRLAAQAQADRIRQASLNPSAEVETAHINERHQRREAQRQGDEARRTAANSSVGGVNQPTLSDTPLPVPQPAAPAPSGSAPAPAPEPAPAPAPAPASAPAPAPEPAPAPAPAPGPAPAPAPASH
jgi:hypothetical protein